MKRDLVFLAATSVAILGFALLMQGHMKPVLLVLTAFMVGAVAGIIALAVVPREED